MRVSSPPSVGPCHYGIDTPDQEELVAHRHTPEEIGKLIGADSLGYLSLAGLRKASSVELKRGFCDACFSLEYPVPIGEEDATPQLSLFRSLEDEAEE